jgi:hypothetical protein
MQGVSNFIVNPAVIQKNLIPFKSRLLAELMQRPPAHGIISK